MIGKPMRVRDIKERLVTRASSGGQTIARPCSAVGRERCEDMCPAGKVADEGDEESQEHEERGEPMEGPEGRRSRARENPLATPEHPAGPSPKGVCSHTCLARMVSMVRRRSRKESSGKKSERPIVAGVVAMDLAPARRRGRRCSATSARTFGQLWKMH